ncbi:MAG: NifB/NifX family molybdenum-iron cluster-binding protein [Bacillota bacterium]|nr:NifB/NifX family molybdenum-iron cluster-binding protein [Bacillota bacterium]
MNIAIATQGREAQSLIPKKLAEADFLFIVDVEAFEVKQILNAVKENTDVYFARETVAQNCEAILCGDIEKDAFEILAKASVSRYNASGHSATQAVKLMNAYQLTLIREYSGGPGCGGETHHHHE